VGANVGGIGSLESQIGRPLAIDMHYYGWLSLFPGLQESSDLANRRLSVDSWDCSPSNAQVASGSQDPLIVTRAQAIKNFGHPVFVRYLWDMNLSPGTTKRSVCYDPATDNSDGSFSGPQFVAAWQHIRTIFTQQQVTNAIWVWSISSQGGDPRPYYPGDASVDWVSVDAYNAAGGDFASTFSGSYGAVVGYKKPVMISETGAVSVIQPAFFTGAAAKLQSQFPAVKAILYYDGDVQGFHWVLSGSGLTAFSNFAADPYVAAFGTL